MYNPIDRPSGSLIVCEINKCLWFWYNWMIFFQFTKPFIEFELLPGAAKCLNQSFLCPQFIYFTNFLSPSNWKCIRFGKSDILDDSALILIICSKRGFLITYDFFSATTHDDLILQHKRLLYGLCHSTTKFSELIGVIFFLTDVVYLITCLNSITGFWNPLTNSYLSSISAHEWLKYCPFWWKFLSFSFSAEFMELMIHF